MTDYERTTTRETTTADPAACFAIRPDSTMSFRPANIFSTRCIVSLFRFRQSCMKGPSGARVAAATRCGRGERKASRLHERKTRGPLDAPARIGSWIDQ